MQFFLINICNKLSLFDKYQLFICIIYLLNENYYKNIIIKNVISKVSIDIVILITTLIFNQPN